MDGETTKTSSAMQLGRLVAMVVLSLGAVAHAAPNKTIVLRAAELHLGNGEVIADGMLVVRDGVIAQVGKNLEVPAGATVIESKGGTITPGLIDANAAVEVTDMLPPKRRSARAVLHDFFCPSHGHELNTGCCGSTCSRALLHVSGEPCAECNYPNAAPVFAVGTRSYASLAEDSSEVIPHTRVIDSVNLRSNDFMRLARGGVTTVFVAPDSAAVIGSQGAIVRTGGPLNERIVREADAVKATMGTDPSWRGGGNSLPWRENVTFNTRRPRTRMGVAWVFRKAMYDTRRDQRGLETRGADTPSTEAMHTLRRVLSGEIPLRIQARQRHDIAAACRLAAEFGLPFVLEEATGAHLCLDELKSKGVPVIYGPIFMDATGHRAWSSEVNRSRLHTMKALLDAGVETALTAHELRDEDGLARQAMYARRYGVSMAQVMQAVTSVPARILGIEGDVGTLETGKRADIVLWGGGAFEATSKPTVVMIGGHIVVDRRKG